MIERTAWSSMSVECRPPLGAPSGVFAAGAKTPLDTEPTVAERVLGLKGACEDCMVEESAGQIERQLQ